ncbi:MAG TPA: hypothetical protein VKU90_00250 [Caulobacteraceae bacterium]|jgi:hypothetical protein|nr:hypothetical protein [Caulobacteraceae bacterium]
MAERNFEFELTRLFGEAPAMPDSEVFTYEVGERLRRGWGWRRLVIGGMGLVGGVIAGLQLLGGGVLERLDMVSTQGGRVVTGAILDAAAYNIAALPMTSDVIWLAAALAAAAIVFAITRVVREF